MTPLRLRYQTIEFDSTDIHLCTLRDNQQFYDPEDIAKNLGISSALWPLFGIIWPSGVMLANHIEKCDTQNKRILEIGCGMALSSLLLNSQNADITATDYHPNVGEFLLRNTELNNDKPIAYEQVDWADGSDTLGLFDLIIGSDVLYEDEHIELLAHFINDHANAKCDVVLVDPDRGRKGKLSKLMIKLGFDYTPERAAKIDHLGKDYKGHILTFTR